MRRAARIGAEGQRFVSEELADDALDCYWAEALVRYGRRVQKLADASDVGELSSWFDWSRHGRAGRGVGRRRRRNLRMIEDVDEQAGEVFQSPHDHEGL